LLNEPKIARTILNSVTPNLYQSILWIATLIQEFLYRHREQCYVQLDFEQTQDDKKLLIRSSSFYAYSYYWQVRNRSVIIKSKINN
jgi:hypothetical protein